MSDVTDTFYAGEAFIGYGSQIMAGDGASPETFEAILDVVEITPGKMGTDVVEKTHLRSPARHKEKLLALRDSAAWTLKCNYVPTHESQSKAGGGSGAFASGGMLAKWISGVEGNYKLVCADGSPATEVPMAGAVSGYQIGGFAAGQKVDLTIEITPLRDFSSSLP